MRGVELTTARHDNQLERKLPQTYSRPTVFHGRTTSCGFVAYRIAGTSIGFSHGFTLRCGVLGYYDVDRCEEAEMKAPRIQRSSFSTSRRGGTS